ncbi:MAG TPA: linear amide C-N hydrolase [Thermoanaerobaculia bacterium]
MKKRMGTALLLALCGWTVAREAAACTTFCLKDQEALLFGKNYDWSVDDALLVVNKRGVAKTAMLPPKDRPATWVSKYGSVTFNQYGREFPNGGMNEAGLVVELMWLDDTRYPDPDGRPGLDCLEWIQYQLDRFDRVEDVVREAGRVRIVSMAKIHYLVCDRTGACATIEFLDGRLVPHSGGELPVPVLTNHTYAESLGYLRRSEAAPGSKAFEGGSSLARFARASSLLRSYRPGPGGKPPVDYAFDVLDSVAQGPYTQWSIVYDLRSKRVHYRTRENRAIRRFDLAAFDFSCSTPVKVLDIHQGAGDVARRFAAYRPEANRDLVARSFRGTEFLAGVPSEEIAAVAAHPQSTSCRR